MEIGLVVHPSNPVGDSIRVLTEFAGRQRRTLIARESDAERVGPGVALVPEDTFADRVDALVALGGDGTMLGAMRLVVGRPVPVLGVNHGNVGFLVEVTPDELPDALDRLVDGRFTLEPHSCLDAFCPESGEATVAFNDVVLTAAEPWASLTADLVVNGSRHGYYRGDAVIACTPTGSTAYNYAAGGPIVSPSAPSITLTPVAPMAGISRPVVLGGADVVGVGGADIAAPVRRGRRDLRHAGRRRDADRPAAAGRGERGPARRGHPHRPQPGEAQPARPAAEAGPAAGADPGPAARGAALGARDAATE